MIPLALPVRPANRAIYKRHPATRHQDPAQRLAVAIIRRRVYGQPHEDVSRPVDGHEAVDHLPVRRRRRRLELEELKRVQGPEHGVDPETDEYRREHAGRNPEGRRLREDHAG